MSGQIRHISRSADAANSEDVDTSTLHRAVQLFAAPKFSFCKSCKLTCTVCDPPIPSSKGETAICDISPRTPCSTPSREVLRNASYDGLITLPSMTRLRSFIRSWRCADTSHASVWDRLGSCGADNVSIVLSCTADCTQPHHCRQPARWSRRHMEPVAMDHLL